MIKCIQSLTGITLIILLSGCDFNQKIDTNLALEIPKIPKNWDYFSCPNYIDSFEDCDFELPIPKNANLEVEREDSMYFWTSGIDIPSAHFVNATRYKPDDLLNKNFNDIVKEGLCTLKNNAECFEIDFIQKKDVFQIARAHKGSEYRFWIKTPTMLLIVLDPSLGTVFGPSITPENISVLDSIILNIRSKPNGPSYYYNLSGS